MKLLQCSPSGVASSGSTRRRGRPRASRGSSVLSPFIPTIFFSRCFALLWHCKSFFHIAWGNPSCVFGVGGLWMRCLLLFCVCARLWASSSLSEERRGREDGEERRSWEKEWEVKSWFRDGRAWICFLVWLGAFIRLAGLDRRAYSVFVSLYAFFWVLLL